MIFLTSMFCEHGVEMLQVMILQKRKHRFISKRYTTAHFED